MSPQNLISIIVCVSANWAIGKNNQLAWHLSADLKRFKALTTNHTVLMGRKTHESIGKPLPNRQNIILSNDKKLVVEGCTVVHSLQNALDASLLEGEIFVIGGGQIYEQALPLCQKIYLTQIHKTIDDADAFFPKIDFGDWQIIEQTHHLMDEKNEANYTFTDLIRK